MSEPHFEVPRLFKNEQNQRKSLGLFFAASGTGKFVREDLYSKINANPCVYFFSEPQIETPTCIYARYSKAAKENSDILMPELATSMKGGAKSLIYKGTNGRWRDTLTKSDLGKYELVASRNLPPECARWLANGTSI